MGFVENDEVGVQIVSPVHGVVELVAQDLGGAYDDRRARVFLAVACQDAYVLCAKDGAELGTLGVAQRFQRRGVPRPASLPEDAVDGSFGDPRLARPGWGGHQAVCTLDGVDRPELERIGLERGLLRHADGRKDPVQAGIGMRFDLEDADQRTAAPLRGAPLLDSARRATGMLGIAGVMAHRFSLSSVCAGAPGESLLIG